MIKNYFSLSGKLVLVTGATGGLGAEIADVFAGLGADLILVDRDGTPLDDACSFLRDKWNVSVSHKYCDLESEVERGILASDLSKNVCGLDVLINNAAFVGTSDLKGWNVSFEEQSLDSWRRAMEVNVTAVFDLCQRLFPLLKASHNSSIVNIASIYGVYGPDWSMYENTGMSNPAAYSASKGALIQLTRWLSRTMAPNTRVNCVSPGGIFRNQNELFVTRYEKKTPLGRMATENDICGAIAFLASDSSSYITGQNIIVDGGWGV
jgi:NAD(P)-dependent dehydrogenase (short-subunit alcohol dehydrogenase family)